MIYTQKWSIVSFLEPVNEGTQFHWKDWPLHITLASVFAVNWSKELLAELQIIANSTHPFTLQAVGVGLWGNVDKYHCAILKKTQEITNLHTAVFELLEKYGASFNEIQYHGEGFIPHITYQKHSRVETGETVTLTSFSIIDMFPGGDHLERFVYKTFNLN